MWHYNIRDLRSVGGHTGIKIQSANSNVEQEKSLITTSQRSLGQDDRVISPAPLILHTSGIAWEGKRVKHPHVTPGKSTEKASHAKSHSWDNLF